MKDYTAQYEEALIEFTSKNDNAALNKAIKFKKDSNGNPIGKLVVLYRDINDEESIEVWKR